MLFDVVVLTIFSCNKDKSWPPRSGLQMTLINDKFVVRWSCQVCMFYLHIWQITCLEGLFQIKYQTNLSLKLTLKEFEKIHHAGIISYLWTWYLKPFYQFCNWVSNIIFTIYHQYCFYYTNSNIINILRFLCCLEER